MRVSRPFEFASECPAESVASGDTFAPSAPCGAEFFSEQEREKSVFPAAALMRFEEEPDEEAIHDCGGSVAGCAAGATVRIEPEYRTRIKSYVTEHKIRPVETQERIVVGAKVPTDVELTAVPRIGARR